MSDGRGVLLACAMVALAPSLGAQSVAEMRARVAWLEAAQQRAAGDLERSDSARQSRLLADTLRVGALTIVGQAELVNRARAGATTAWGLLDAKFGRQAARVAPLLFVLVSREVENVAPRAPNRRIRPISVEPGTTDAMIAHMIGNTASIEINAAHDSALRAWLGSATLDVRAHPRERYRDAYVELATDPWTATRSCYQGDVAACRRALGLEPGDLLDQWYDAGDRQRVVIGNDPVSWRGASLRDLARCRDGGDDVACTTVLRAVSFDWIEPPFTPPTRAFVVDVALELGGAEAYDRLLTTRGPIAARLAAAARLPLDSVVRAWRARLIDAAPATVTVYPAGAWAALLWAAVLAVVGLGSSRWR